MTDYERGIADALKVAMLEWSGSKRTGAERETAWRIADAIRSLAAPAPAAPTRVQCRDTSAGPCQNTALPGKLACWQHGGDMLPHGFDLDAHHPSEHVAGHMGVIRETDPTPDPVCGTCGGSHRVLADDEMHVTEPCPDCCTKERP